MNEVWDQWSYFAEKVYLFVMNCNKAYERCLEECVGQRVFLNSYLDSDIGVGIC
jgi:hypothetical protein